MIELSNRPTAKPAEKERVKIGWSSSGPIYADEMAERSRVSTVRLALTEIADMQGDADAFIAQYEKKPGKCRRSPLRSRGDRTAYLIDMQGNVVHTWTMPYPAGHSGYLTDRGALFYNGQIPNESHVGRAPYRGGSALEMTWDGHILWEVKHPDHNYDGIRLRNGNVMLICQKPLPDGIAAKARGGRPGTEYD